MFRLQNGRQAFNGLWGLSFVDCQEKFVHQLWHCFLRHWREPYNENVDISKPEYGWWILISRIKMPVFIFYICQNYEILVQSFQHLRKRRNFSSSFDVENLTTFCRLKSPINGILRILLHVKFISKICTTCSGWSCTCIEMKKVKLT